MDSCPPKHGKNCSSSVPKRQTKGRNKQNFPYRGKRQFFQPHERLSGHLRLQETREQETRYFNVEE